MGNGIAQICAAAGLSVVMVDISDAAVNRGLSTVGGSLERLVKKEKMSAADRDATLKRITGTTDRAKLADCDLVIEAATENEELKVKILKDLCATLSPRTLLATNTSSISITKLAAATDRPDRFIGMHFFNPVPVMALLELIRGLQTSDDTHAKALDFAKRVGKVAITAKNSPGFAVNRILCPMINEAIFALQEGIATAEEIDAGMKLGCNHPIGPLALADLVGLDTMLSVMEVFYKGFNDPNTVRPPCSRKWSTPAISAARPARASTPIAPDGAGGGCPASAVRSPQFALRQRRRAQLARQCRTGGLREQMNG
ncbi:3-hydroxyacyl-CoA dehydrogenase NAD-binding domain-containing protein [Bradyrhizobium japonicum]